MKILKYGLVLASLITASNSYGADAGDDIDMESGIRRMTWFSNSRGTTASGFNAPMCLGEKDIGGIRFEIKYYLGENQSVANVYFIQIHNGNYSFKKASAVEINDKRNEYYLFRVVRK